MCAGYHLTSACEKLLSKRAYNKEKIDEKLIKCVNCNGGHTAGYLKCPYRLDILSRRQPKKTNFIDAPVPPVNIWNRRAIQPLPTPTPTTMNPKSTPLRDNRPMTSPSAVLNQPISPFQRPQVNSTDNSSHLESDKFNAQEIGSIFSHIIRVIDQCKSKSEQLQVMMQIITQYYI